MAKGYPDYEGDKSGLYLKPEWAAKEGTDKNFFVARLNVAYLGFASATYTVPAKKTLYVCGLTFSVIAVAAVDADKNQVGTGYLRNDTDGIVLLDLGGNAGNWVTFPKPIVVAAGKDFLYAVYNFANHRCHIAISVWGYEI